MALETGGGATSHARTLFALSGGAGVYTAGPWAWDAGPLWDGYTYLDYFNNPVSNEPPQNVAIGTHGNLNTNGVLYTTLPDNSILDVTPSVAGVNDYEFSLSARRYDSYIQVFIRQPYPDYPHDLSDYLVGDMPTPPVGYPIYQPGGREAGHAWWNLTNTAPSTVLNQLIQTNDLQWLESDIGYAPITNYFVSYLPPIKQGPGEIDTNNGTEYDVYRVYRVGFSGPGLVDGLGYTGNLSNAPGTWNSDTNNCAPKPSIPQMHAVFT